MRGRAPQPCAPASSGKGETPDFTCGFSSASTDLPEHLEAGSDAPGCGEAPMRTGRAAHRRRDARGDGPSPTAPASAPAVGPAPLDPMHASRTCAAARERCDVRPAAGMRTRTARREVASARVAPSREATSAGPLQRRTPDRESRSGVPCRASAPCFRSCTSPAPRGPGHGGISRTGCTPASRRRSPCVRRRSNPSARRCRCPGRATACRPSHGPAGRRDRRCSRLRP